MVLIEVRGRASNPSMLYASQSTNGNVELCRETGADSPGPVSPLLQDDDLSGHLFDVEFVRLAGEGGEVEVDELLSLLESAGIRTSESELMSVVAAMFGEKDNFTLPEATAIAKELSSNNAQAPCLRDAPPVQDIRKFSLVSRVVQYCTLSEESIVSGRKLIMLTVAILFMVTLIVGLVSVTYSYSRGKSTAEAAIYKDLLLLKSSVESVSALLLNEKFNKLNETSSLLLSFIAYTEARVEASMRSSIDLIQVVLDAELNSIFNFYMTPLVANVKFLHSLGTSGLLPLGDETSLNNILINRMGKLDASFSSMFYHCSDRPSTNTNIPRSILDATLTLNSTYLSLYSNGSYLASNLYSGCLTCDKIVISDRLPGSCSIGTILLPQMITENLRERFTSMVDDVNIGIKEKRNDTTEIVFYSRYNSTHISARSEFQYCTQPPCQRLYPLDSQIGETFKKNGKATRLDYSGTPVFSSFSYNPTLDSSVRVKFPLYSVVDEIQAEMSALSNQSKKTNVAVDSYVLSPNSTNPTNPTSLDIVQLEIGNDTSVAASWVSEDGRNISGIVTTYEWYGYKLRVFVSQDDEVVDNQTLSVVGEMVNGFNKLDSSVLGLAAFYRHETWELLTPVGCPSCVLDSPIVKMSQREGPVRKYVGHDFSNVEVIAVTVNTNGVALSVSKTQSSISDSLRSGLVVLGVSSAAPLICGSMAMWILVYLIARQVRSLIFRRSEMQERLAELDKVLQDLFPKSIKAKLLGGGTALEAMADISASLVDIHGFTPVLNTLSAQQIQTLLSYVFDVMDDVAKYYGVNKVKTIGDSYVSICGLEGESIYKNDSCNAMFTFVVNILLIFSRDISHRPEIEAIFDLIMAIYEESRFQVPRLTMRAGMAKGYVLGGILSSRVPSFDVWGPAIGLASRLEASSHPGTVMISEDVQRSITQSDHFPDIRLDGPHHVYCKRFGSVRAYLLHSANIGVPKELMHRLELDQRIKRHNYLTMTSEGAKSTGEVSDKRSACSDTDRRSLNDRMSNDFTSQ